MSQRTPFGSFTIIVDREYTNLTSQMTVQHIIKSVATEKSPEAILFTDLDLTKFIVYLIVDVEYDMILDHIEYRLPNTDIIQILALEDRKFQTAISKIYNRLWWTGQSEIRFTVPSRTYLTGYLPPIETFAILDCENDVQLAAENAISDTGLVPKQNTSDGGCTLVVEHQKFHADGSSLRIVKGWKWALIVSAILSSLFMISSSKPSKMLENYPGLESPSVLELPLLILQVFSFEVKCT